MSCLKQHPLPSPRLTDRSRSPSFRQLPSRMGPSNRHERQLPPYPFKALHANTNAASRAEAPNGLEQCLHLDSTVVPAQTANITPAAEIRAAVRRRPRAGDQNCRGLPDSCCERQVAAASISEARHCVRGGEGAGGSKPGIQPHFGVITIADRICASDDTKTFGPLVVEGPLAAIWITVQGHREMIGTSPGGAPKEWIVNQTGGQGMPCSWRGEADEG
jgi:hypothetical protein